MSYRLALFTALVFLCRMPPAAADEFDGWTPTAQRDEIRPDFSTESQDGRAVLIISAAGRPGVDGAWVKTFAVQGGRHYRFTAWRHTRDIAVPRRSVLVKITWQNDKGQLVPGPDDLARPEYPLEEEAAGGGTLVADTYRVPDEATQARVELRLRWTEGSVRWSDVELVPVEPPPPRIVRLAAVHFRPRDGQTSAQKCALFAPLIQRAAQQSADLVVLPESLTYYGSAKTLVEVAEPIPGPSTEYFAGLAKQHDLYIVAGLTERDGALVYNTAILVGPEGQLVGKYRKVCLPREEIEAGVTPGAEYPVFQTRFGKVGLMVCWDVHFPEVARNLCNNGAEVIALPIWGGNPALARARAIENQVYLVSSTYTDLDRDWMMSGVWDHKGDLLVKNGSQWGLVLVAEVDLNQRTQWWWLGDFKARIARERPAGGFEE